MKSLGADTMSGNKYMPKGVPATLDECDDSVVKVMDATCEWNV